MSDELLARTCLVGVRVSIFRTRPVVAVPSSAPTERVGLFVVVFFTGGNLHAKGHADKILRPVAIQFFHSLGTKLRPFKMTTLTASRRGSRIAG